jgi:hypothetical protein
MKPISLEDYRGLPIGVVDHNGKLYLDDEKQALYDAGEFPLCRVQLTQFDLQLWTFNMEKEYNRVLPKFMCNRDELRRYVLEQLHKLAPEVMDNPNNENQTPTPS